MGGFHRAGRAWLGLVAPVALASIAAAALAALMAGCGADDGRQQNYDGPWVRHTIDDSGRGADGVRIDDVNGDGWPDIATGWEQEGVTRVYLHPGARDVRDEWPRVTVGSTPHVEDAVFADVDGDGRLDVVSSAEGRTRAVFVSFAPSDPADLLDPAAWQTERFPGADGLKWMYALPVDVDADGWTDLVVGGKQAGAIVGWLEAPAGGDRRDLARWSLHEIADAGWIMSIDAVDMNDDGRLDLLISDNTLDGVWWLEKPVDPDLLRQPWNSHLVGARNRSPVFIAPVLEDSAVPHAIVVPSGGERLTVFEREDSSGQRWSEHLLDYGHRLGTPKSAAVGDIDLDGVLDVVVAGTNLSGWDEGLVWLSHAAVPGDPQIEKLGISGAQGEKFDRIELVDLDGDGDLDVLTTEELQGFGVIWYENPLRPAG